MTIKIANTKNILTLKRDNVIFEVDKKIFKNDLGVNPTIKNIIDWCENNFTMEEIWYDHTGLFEVLDGRW